MRNLRSVGDLPAVLLKVTQLSEGLLTVRAGVGFHSGVDADMLGQVTRVGKGLGTVGTLVGLCICVVPDDQRRQDGKRKK